MYMVVSALAAEAPCSQHLAAHHRDDVGKTPQRWLQLKYKGRNTITGTEIHNLDQTWQIIIQLKHGVPGLLQKWLESVGATAFGLDGEGSHQKHYSSKKPNPLPSHAGWEHHQGDQTHFAPPKPLLLCGSPSPAQRPKSSSCAWHRGRMRIFAEASPSLVNPPVAWIVTFCDDLNGLCLHQTHSIKGLKLLNNSCCKYLEIYLGWTESWKSNKSQCLI